MVKKHHRLISMILCFALVIAAVCTGTVGALAATGDTVYVKANNGWNKLYCYMWKDGLGDNHAWPGVEMTKVKDNIYSYTLSKDFNMVIFNNGSNGAGQTEDLPYPGNGKIYDLSAKTWSQYEDVSTTSATAATQTSTSAVQPTTEDVTTPVGGTTVYLQNDANFSAPYCYMWNNNTDNNGGWPGAAMTYVGENIYQYTASKSFAKCIFSSNGQNQTADLDAYDGYVYNNKTGKWTIYDTSPLVVKSFGIDPEKNIYADSDVLLSAEAYNKNGASVQYKFSVTNSNGGTSVLSDFSNTKSVVWTPATAGSYKLIFDFIDSDGNTNQRTTEVTVGDDSALVKPIIKGVSPMNLNLIKVGSVATVSVKAGGGKTGTNLLFYKYVVTDPNGVKNTPYYTLNSTYSFKPAMAGTYTVTVYVQGSDNATVNKTYTYTATQTGPTTPAPITTVPSTTKPTVKPTPTTQKPTSSSFILGDADHDGRLTVEDATYIQKALVKFAGYIATVDVCDFNCDGRVDIKDATAIQLKLVRG